MIELKVVELVSKTITETEKRKVTRVKTMKNFVGLTEKGKEMINIYESIKFLK
jgi:predicted transcriptional regulator